MSVYLVAGIALEALAIYILARTFKAAQSGRAFERARADLAEARLAKAAEEIRKREEERRALEQDIIALRRGAPGARLDASLGILRDVSSATGAAAAPLSRVADTPPSARRNRP